MNWNPYGNGYVGEGTMFTNLTQQQGGNGLMVRPESGLSFNPAQSMPFPQAAAQSMPLAPWNAPALPPPWMLQPNGGYCPPGPLGAVNPHTYLQWLQAMLQGVGPVLATNTGVRPYRDGESAIAQPTRWSDQPLGLGSTTLAAGATANITTNNAKRGMIKGLRLLSDTGGPTPALVNSITAAGQTLLAGAASVPGGYFAQVDNFGNLSSPELMPNSPLVVNVTNGTAAPIVITGNFIMRVAE